MTAPNNKNTQTRVFLYIIVPILVYTAVIFKIGHDNAFAPDTASALLNLFLLLGALVVALLFVLALAEHKD